MKISIITITYNSAKTLTDTLESVLAQTYKEIEYIIVDGASKDGTMDIVKNTNRCLREKCDGLANRIRAYMMR